MQPVHHSFLFYLVLGVFSEDSDVGKQRQRIGIFEPNYWDIHRSKLYDGLISHQDQPVPVFFDARKYWPECESIGRIYDQGDCGFSWAVSVTSSLSDRLCIFSNGTDKFEYSAEDVLTCCEDCVPTNETSPNRCANEGYFYFALKYIAEHGAVSGGEYLTNSGCKPMSESTVIRGLASPCYSRCTNPKYEIPYEKDKRFIRGVKLLSFMLTRSREEGIKQVQLEILNFGPVVSYIIVPASFMFTYRSGVLKNITHHEENEDEFRYFVKIIGWGMEDDNTPYWLCSNSWGTNWGLLNGTFKIIRGRNFSGIENFFVAPTFQPLSNDLFFDYDTTSESGYLKSSLMSFYEFKNNIVFLFIIIAFL